MASPSPCVGGESGPRGPQHSRPQDAEAAAAAVEEGSAALGVEKSADATTVAGDKAAEREAVDKASVAPESGDKKAPATREGLTPLPKDEVERVLSWKRGKLTSIYSTPEAIEVFETLSDHCAEYQAWMRAEYEANDGVVWVDDEFLKDQAEGIQELKNYWKEEKLGEANHDFDFSRWP